MRGLNISVCGGDESAARLCARLRDDGHRVRAFALDGGDVGEGVMKVGCPEGSLNGAELVILPPAAAANGRLYAPLCSRSVEVSTLLDAAPETALICAGGEVSGAAGYCEDYTAREDFAVGWAALAAEGAVELALTGSDGALVGSRALVLGYGWLGQLLCARLRALGAEVTAAARREGALAMAAAMGCRTVKLSALDGRLGDFDYLFNTVPAPVLSTKRLAEIRCGAFLAELAGEPGGFDGKTAQTLGIRAVEARNLPGKCAPQAAAELIRTAVYAAAEEWKV